jgi:cold-inducible RNA-binding protein
LRLEEKKGMAKKLYVGNLNYDTTEAALTEFFGSVGEVVSATIITDRMSGRSRGFGFVEMVDAVTVQKAINQLNGQELDGRPLRVAEARPPQSRNDRRGGGRDRY